MVQELNQTQYAITGEIATALITLGAKSDIISIVKSWGDTLTEEEVLDNLKTWNAKNPPRHQ